MKKYVSVLLALMLVLSLLSGCGSSEDGTDGGEASLPSSSDMFTDRDRDASYDESTAVKIVLNGDSATASSDSVKIDGSVVTITEEATYVISGTLDDGSVVIQVPDDAKPHIVLKGASITSSDSAALYINNADKVFVTLAEGTENTLANGGSFENADDGVDGTLFSRDDLTINGSGALSVSSPSGHGIVCKDDLVLTGGSYDIDSAYHGLDANDSIRIAGASLDIESGKDALHSENNDDDSLGFIYIESGSIDAVTEGDGISSGAYVQIEGGSFTLVCGGGSENGTKSTQSGDGFMGGTGSMPGGGGPGGMPGGDPGSNAGGGPGDKPDAKTDGGIPGEIPGGGDLAVSDGSNTDSDDVSTKGLKAGGDLYISGGEFLINSADDGIHSNASIVISGGSFDISTGDDGVHADDTLTVTDCDMVISESYEGLEALHLYIKGGDITVTASDDGLNAAGDSATDDPGNSSSNGSIVISGGKLYIKASGDGIDANGTLEISGGYIVVTGPTQGDTATLDYDKTGVITGGTFIGTGASGMAQSFSDSEQGVIALRVGSQSAGTQIVLKDSDGNTVITHSPELDFEIVIISSPDIVKGETYTLCVGSSQTSIDAS